MITRSELLALIYRFYPRGVPNFARIHVPPNEVFYDDTEEHRRLVEAANRGRIEYPTWKGLIERLDNGCYLQNESFHLFAGGVAPAYSARIFRLTEEEPVRSCENRAVLSFHVSLLGPYYGIHDRGDRDGRAAVIASAIEAAYPGYQQIPPEIGNQVVPDVAMDGALMGDATIYICLFSDEWRFVDPA
jgi:hypothetical protein